MRVLVVDALARSTGRKYSTHDVIGAGPRIVAGIVSSRYDTTLLPYERVVKNGSLLRSVDYLFISAMSSDKGALENLVEYAKKENPSITIVVGGPVSFEYYNLLSNRNIDYVIVGEAEIPLLVFLDCVVEGKCEETSVPALGFRSGEETILTSRHVHTPRELLSSLKPWTRINEMLEYPQVYRIYVEIVRGCSNFSRPMVREYDGLNCVFCGNCRSASNTGRLTCPSSIPPGCGFCSVPAMFGWARSRSIESITREVEELVEHGARRIVLSAPDFLDYGRDLLVDGPLTNPCHPQANVYAIEELLSSLYSLKHVGEGRVTISIENIKACLVNEDVAGVLGKYLKGTTVHIGLETGSDVFNDKVLGKPISVSDVLRAARLLRGNGLRPYVYLMHSLPFASRKVYEETINVVRELGRIGVEKITLYKYTPLPYTAFEKIPPWSRGVEDYIVRLKKIVDKYNLIAKRSILGSTLEAYLVESSGKLYGYPVKHGPVIFLGRVRREGLSGCLALVKVTKASTRYVVGEVVRIIECPGEP